MPTSKPVPSQDPSDLLFNAQKLDEVVTGTDLTYTDRKGVLRKTLAGILDMATTAINAAIYSLATITVRGAWTPATAYAVKDVVQQGGTWYVAVVPHVSAAAFATDQATKWRVYQGVTTGDLSAGSGSALVGHADAVHPIPYLQTVSDILNGLEVSALRFVPPAKHAGIRGGTNTDALDSYLTDAAASAKRVFLPGGTWNLGGPVLMPVDTAFRGEGRRTVLVQPLAGYASGPLFARQNYASANLGGCDNLALRSLRIKDDRTTSAFWTIDFSNGASCTLEDIEVKSDAVGENLKIGAAMGKGVGSTYAGDTFLGRVHRCRFSQASVLMNATDWYITESELWGGGFPNTREFALAVSGGGFLGAGSQLVGGSEGALKLFNNSNFDISTLKVLGVYFDGSYITIDSGDGIYCDPAWTGNLRDSLINCNNFWRQNKRGIHLSKMRGGQIIGNTFEDCDSKDAGWDDIVVDAMQGATIGPNTHGRGTTPKTGTGTTARVNIGKPMTLTGIVGSPTSRIVGGSVYFSNNYNASVFTNPALFVATGAHPKMQPTYTSLPTASDFTLQIARVNGIPYVSNGSEWTALPASVPTAGAGGDFNTFTTTLTTYITDATGWLNAPASFSSTGAPFVLRVTRVNANAAAQELFKPGTTNRFTRSLSGGAWGAWA